MRKAVLITEEKEKVTGSVSFGRQIGFRFTVLNTISLSYSEHQKSQIFKGPTFNVFLMSNIMGDIIDITPKVIRSSSCNVWVRTWPREKMITLWERSGSYLESKKIPNFLKHILVEVCAL